MRQKNTEDEKREATIEYRRKKRMGELSLEELNIPQEPGFYWAGFGVGEFDLIVYIYGDKPYLVIDVWDFKKREVLKDVPVRSLEFGKKIEKDNGYFFVNPDVDEGGRSWIK